MAVVLDIAFDRYFGLALDTKPTAGVKPGTLFRETDTGAEFRYDGAKWWPTVATAAARTEDAPARSRLEELQLILIAEMRQVRMAICMASNQVFVDTPDLFRLTQ